MKEKILDIFYEELELVQSGYLNGNCELKGREDAAERISQIMCDREAKLTYCAFYAVNNKISLGESKEAIKQYTRELISIIGKDVFTEDQINKAIEKLK